MLNKAFSGNARYLALLSLLLGTAVVGIFAYARQLQTGLNVTGLSRDVPWGLYISQFTFLVGCAASAVTVVLPYYLHDVKAFSKIVIVGEMLAVAATIMCMLFILVDMGRPDRVLNVMRYPTLSSPMFFDMAALLGYLALNCIIGFVTLDAERKGTPPPQWIRFLIMLSIPWAISIHTVTAFLYSGLLARHLFMTAIMAPRFLASAFAAGPGLLILIVLALKRYAGFDAGEKAISKLAIIVTYAMATNVFFILVELFTALYGNIPLQVHSVEYLYLGLSSARFVSPFMIVSSLLAVVSLVLLLTPSLRRKSPLLIIAMISVVLSLWLDKGLSLIVAGFVPNPLGYVREYRPTVTEIRIALGIFGAGGLVLTMLLKIVMSVRRENEV